MSAIVVGEIALVQALLVSAGLVLLSQRELLRVDPGYRAGNALSFSLALSSANEENASDRLAFYRELRRRLEAVPGVTSVGASSTFRSRPKTAGSSRPRRRRLWRGRSARGDADPAQLG